MSTTAFEAVKNELKGASLFFQKEQQKQAPQALKSAPGEADPAKVVSQVLKADIEPNKATQQQTPEEAVIEVTNDVMVDVTTSILSGVDMKKWQEVIEDTETHNSSLRMSAEEKEQIEDVLRELKREFKVKTSINEIARLGLLLLAHDFNQRGKQSIIALIKKA